MIIKELELPFIRSDVHITFRQLSDLQMQKEKWVGKPEGYKFSHSINLFIFDDLFEGNDLEEDNYTKIGKIIYDEEEAEALNKFCPYLFELLNKRMGWDHHDSYYLEHPEWPYVAEESRKIYELMQRKNEEYGYREFVEYLEKKERQEYLDSINSEDIEDESNETK